MTTASTRLARGAIAIGLGALAVVAIEGINSHPAEAAGDTVTTCANSGPGSLRQTVTNAAAGDTIDFAVSCATIRRAPS